MTPDEFRRAGHALVEWIAAYREQLAAGTLPVQARVGPGDLIAALPAAAPEHGEPFTAVLADLERLIVPGITHWQHPRFFGYFPSGGSLTSVLGDMVSTGLGVIGLNWQASPALTELEQVTTDWLRDLLGLPAQFSGVLQDTASAASFVALVCARERATDYGAARAGLQGGGAPLVVYTSAQAHSSIEKAALLAGFGREHVRAIELDAAFRMQVPALEAAIRRDRAAGLVPCAVVATYRHHRDDGDGPDRGDRGGRRSGRPVAARRRRDGWCGDAAPRVSPPLGRHRGGRLDRRQSAQVARRSPSTARCTWCAIRSTWCG